MRTAVRILLLLGCYAIGLSPVIALADPAGETILHWNRVPLPVPLIVGEQRVVIVGEPLRVGVPTSLNGQLQVQSADGAAYLLAKAPIEATQLELQDLRTGELILLDVTARRAAPGEATLEPIRIVDDSGPTDGGKAATAASDGAPSRTQSLPRSPLAVALTRYAAQSLYAPLRTVEPLPGISQVSLPPDIALDTLLPTLPVRATALASWRLAGEWVTAIKLTNTAARWINLDPRLLQGDFVAATFQHTDLGPAGHSTDTTVVYLITRGQGIAESLLPHASRFDATLDLPKPPGAPNSHPQGRRP